MYAIRSYYGSGGARVPERLGMAAGVVADAGVVAPVQVRSARPVVGRPSHYRLSDHHDVVVDPLAVRIVAMEARCGSAGRPDRPLVDMLVAVAGDGAVRRITSYNVCYTKLLRPAPGS